jgi:hypothetical protein
MQIIISIFKFELWFSLVLYILDIAEQIQYSFHIIINHAFQF